MQITNTATAEGMHHSDAFNLQGQNGRDTTRDTAAQPATTKDMAAQSTAARRAEVAQSARKAAAQAKMGQGVDAAVQPMTEQPTEQQPNDGQSTAEHPKEGQSKVACPKEEQPRTYTHEDVQKMLQAEADKRVSDALKTARQKWDGETKLALEQMAEQTRQDVINTAREQADKEAQLQLQQNLDGLLQREAQVTRRELAATANEYLSERGLPKELASILQFSSAEACAKEIKTVEQVFRQAVEAGVTARILSAKIPRVGGDMAASSGTSGIKSVFASLR